MWDAAFEFGHLSKFGDRLWDEIPTAVNKAPFLFLAMFIAVVWFWSGSREKSGQIETLKADKTDLQRDKEQLGRDVTKWSDKNAMNVSDSRKTVERLNDKIQEITQELNGKIQDRDNRISQITQERDKAQLKEQESSHALAQWILLAHSNTTNTPLTKHMAELTSSLSDNTKSISAALKSLEENKPDFSVALNGEVIQPGQVILLQKPRTLLFSATNTSSVTAEKVTLHFIAPISPTNFVVERWTDKSLLMTPTNGTAFTVTADEPIPSGTTFFATTFKISTNFSSGVLAAKVEVFSLGSRRRTIPILFLVP